MNNYGFFSIEQGTNGITLIKIPNHNDKIIYGSNIQVVPLDANHYLISTRLSNIVITNDDKGVSLVELSFSFEDVAEAYDEVYNNSVMIQPPIQIETSPYKMTDNLTSHGLIILRFGTEYVLYNFVNNDVISERFSNISDIDGKLVAEYCSYACYDEFDSGWKRIPYPNDILVGELAYDGTLIGNRLESKKWNTIIQFQEGESISSKVYTYNSVLLCFNDTEPEFDYREYLADKGRV